MGLFPKFLIVAMIIAVMLPFTVLKGKDGRPLMSIGDLKAPDLAMPKLPEIDGSGSVGGSGREDLVYKWKDSSGAWQFSSQPPAAGVEYTVKGYDPNANLIQSVKPKAPEPQAASSTEPAKQTTVSDNSESGISNPYSPQKVEKLFNDAKNVQNLLDNRFKQQEAILGR